MLQIWNDEFQWAAPIAIAGNIFGAVLALAYEMFAWLGLTVFMLPILATSYSFRLYVANTKVYLEKLQHMNEELDEINLGLLETLGAVIDAYDVYTYGHSNQVAVYAGALAEKLGLPETEKVRLIKAALVHDLGKVAVEDSIIGKQGPLTNEEYNLVKRHPLIGAQIVGRMKGFQDLVDPVLHHHERWDGKGYPDGLAGEEIHLGARILALADALDSMFSDRPYRPTRSYKDVIAEVGRCSGTQFDPIVAQAFFALVEEKGRDFFSNSALIVDKNVHPDGGNELDRLERYLKKSMLP
jgi:putative nucleotidyltransferase with HDIG domain